MSLTSREFGNRSEDIASDFLKKLGYIIIERNYKTSLGEIDIVAYDKDTLVFIEVKSRRGKRFGVPQASVDKRKQRKIIRVALNYLANKKINDKSCRFDIVAIQQESGSNKELKLIRNAFEVEDMNLF
ncbi:MAG: YraN family protein [Nitrospirota bacterium]